MEFDFSEEVLRRALLNIYSRDFHPATEIEINLFNEIWAKMDKAAKEGFSTVSYTHLRAHETDSYLVCRLLLEKKKKTR